MLSEAVEKQEDPSVATTDVPADAGEKQKHSDAVAAGAFLEGDEKQEDSSDALHSEVTEKEAGPSAAHAGTLSGAQENQPHSTVSPKATPAEAVGNPADLSAGEKLEDKDALVVRFCEFTGADSEIAEHTIDGAFARGLSFEAAVSYYLEQAAHREQTAKLRLAHPAVSDDGLSASELRAKAQAMNDLSEEDLSLLAYCRSQEMPRPAATWSRREDSWHMSLQGRNVESKFVEYSQHVQAEIEEHFSAWKVGIGASTCTVELGERNLAGGSMGRTLARQVGLGGSCRACIDFQAMTQTDTLTRSRCPVKRWQAP
mmetsp:Transcript_157587/g.278092  ORF Transcript_157587/g.278092 Transcript_157587/m.278092 type:complete len:314 (+) Transcript_157587:72-1013(+)